MRILHICKKLPYPLEDGESIAVYGLAKGLYNLGHSIDLLAMKNLFSNDPIHVARVRSQTFQDRLNILVKKTPYDAIIFETIFTRYYTLPPSVINPKQITRLHNVEHLIWRRICDHKSFFKRWYYRIQTNRLMEFELNQLSKSHLNVALSEDDRFHLINILPKANIKVSGIGLDLGRYQINQKVTDGQKVIFGFIGTIDWQPNLYGLRWFIEQVWSDLGVDAYERAEFHIAGRGALRYFQSDRNKGIVVHDYVDSAIDFISSLDVMIVPLFSGSGQKVKILEALALGKRVISTAIGLEGIPLKNEQLIEANSVLDFKKCVNYQADAIDDIEFILKKELDFNAKSIEVDQMIKDI